MAASRGGRSVSGSLLARNARQVCGRVEKIRWYVAVGRVGVLRGSAPGCGAARGRAVAWLLIGRAKGISQAFWAQWIFGRSAIHNGGAIHPVAPGKQGLGIGNEVTDAHPGFPGITPGIGDIAAQGHCVIETRNDRKDTNNIAIFEGKSARLRVVGEFQSLARLVIANAVNRDLTRIRSEE